MTPAKRLARFSLRLLLILAAIAPLAYAIYREWPALRASIVGIDWGAMAGAELMLISVMLLVVAVPWFSLQSLGAQLSFIKVAGLYFASQVLKYLPGGFWAFPGRIAAYRVAGVGQAESIVSVFRETSALFLGAAAVGLYGVLQGLAVSNVVRTAITLGVLVSIIVILITQLPWFWRFLSRFKFLQSSTVTAYEQVSQKGLSLVWFPQTFLASVAFWLLLGLPFRQMATAVTPDAAALSWVDAASIFALAWCAGFVVVFIPAGIGIREGVLSILLSTVLPVGDALSLALISRAAWILAEAFWILVTLLWWTRDADLSWESLRRNGP
ncbi:MAG: hypothetical protein GTO18_21905 [Anaerolineales bacterium]|nr:hypothetical protein [Anaerolineales bacterium]